MHWNLGGYKPQDIEYVWAFDIDKRKVGKDLSNAIYSVPNCINNLCESVPKSGTNVQMGKILDGYSSHMD
jgi:myo-inositol-1-phosphate synthase